MASTQALDRAAPYLRRPSGCDGPLQIRGGVLDLRGVGPPRRGAQTALDRPVLARAYERLRPGRLRVLLGVPDFETEMARVREALALERGDVVLDLACGHGNFTQALAEAVGPAGLVIGVDLSGAMLERAAARIIRAGLENVLLVHGDAHDLPVADRALAKLHCAGGFHSMPDLPKVLDELARAGAPGARLTASTFATARRDRLAGLKRRLHRRAGVHFVSLEALGHELEERGFGGYRCGMYGPWFGYASARRELS